MEKQKKRLVAKQITNQKQKYSIILFVQEQLGKGSFGECFLGYDPNLRELLAVKAIKAPKHPQDYIDTKKKYKKEIKNLSILTNQKHSLDRTNTRISNLVFVHPVTFKNEQNFYIAMEFCNGGDLQHLIERYSKGFTTSQFLLIMGDILNGYHQIRSNGMIHEDLKPENIFIKDGYFKIGDFGLSFKLLPGQKNRRGGSQPYNAPEKYSPDPPSHKSDIFALGVIFFQMYYGQHPFYTKEQWNNYLIKTVNERVRQDEQLRVIFSQGKTPRRRHEQNKIFVQFLKSSKVKNLKPVIKCQYEVLSKLKHEKLEQIFLKMLQTDISKRLNFQQLKYQLNQLDIPHIKRGILDIPAKSIPLECVIYLQQKEDAQSLTQTLQGIDYKSQIMETQVILEIKEQAQKTIIRSRILADLQYQISRFAETYNQETLKQVAQLLLQQIILFVKSKIYQFEKQLSCLSEEEKVSFYSHDYDSLIGVLKNHASYLRGLFNGEPNKMMQKQNALKLEKETSRFLQNLLLLGLENAYLIAALDLYQKILVGDQQTLRDTKALIEYKNRVIYHKIKASQAEKVYLKRNLKLPPAIEYEEQQ